uniref:Uncharacterized protein n=1 Tax=Anguilla anguilla TaxID=7936 RepID=A0A0E9RZL6_ANGAN
MGFLVGRADHANTLTLPSPLL